MFAKLQHVLEFSWNKYGKHQGKLHLEFKFYLNYHYTFLRLGPNIKWMNFFIPRFSEQETC
jgi:hypothetical protein